MDMFQTGVNKIPETLTAVGGRGVKLFSSQRFRPILFVCFNKTQAFPPEAGLQLSVYKFSLPNEGGSGWVLIVLPAKSQVVPLPDLPQLGQEPNSTSRTIEDKHPSQPFPQGKETFHQNPFTPTPTPARCAS